MQTGSGKTYTMGSGNPNAQDDTTQGISPLPTMMRPRISSRQGIGDVAGIVCCLIFVNRSLLLLFKMLSLLSLTGSLLSQELFLELSQIFFRVSINVGGR